MKNSVFTYEEYMAESAMNEMLKIKDLEKIKKFIESIAKKVHNNELIDSIKDFINTEKLDPYLTWEDILRHLSFAFKKNPEVINVINQEIQFAK